MPNTYVLRNPFLQGTIDTKIKAQNANAAAKEFYSNISEHFNNSVPSFKFTLQKGGSGLGKYYHFEANEERSDNEISYKINRCTTDIDITQFEKNFNKFKTNFDNLVGGKKHKKHKKKHSHKKHSNKNKDENNKDDNNSSSESSSESSSSSSSSYNYYKKINSYLPVSQPIYYWWYDPYVYTSDSIYFPSFYPYTVPYIEISTPYYIIP